MSNYILPSQYVGSVQNQFAINDNDSYLTTSAKASARAVSSTVLAVASAVETLAFALVTAVVSPSYIFTDSALNALANRTQIAGQEFLNALFGIAGYSYTENNVVVEEDNQADTPVTNVDDSKVEDSNNNNEAPVAKTDASQVEDNISEGSVSDTDELEVEDNISEGSVSDTDEPEVEENKAAGTSTLRNGLMGIFKNPITEGVVGGGSAFLVLLGLYAYSSSQNLVSTNAFNATATHLVNNTVNATATHLVNNTVNDTLKILV